MLDRNIGTSDPEVLVDQVSDLSSSEEAVFFMSFDSWKISDKWEWHWSTGKVGISTADWFSIFKISWIIYAINFIL